MPIILDVDWQRSGAAGAMPGSLDKKIGEIVSIADWGVPGGLTTYTPGVTQKIQAALDEAPLGSTLRFPAGAYYTDATLVQSRFVNILFDAGAAVSAIFNNATKNVWEVLVKEAPLSAGDARHLRFDDVYFDVPVGFNAKHTLHIAVAAPLIGNLQCLFTNCFLSARDGQAGSAVHIEGVNTQAHTFINCEIHNQAHLDRCSDGTKFFACLFHGVKTGVLLDMHPGAFRTRIVENLIVCQNGAVLVRDGSEVDIIGNQIEQVGTNALTQQAMVAINATQQPCRGIQIVRNNFGGGSGVERAIWIGTNAATYNNGVLPINLNVRDTFIDQNTFNKPNSAYNVVLADARVVGTRIGPNNYLRGEWGFTWANYPNVPANADDPADLFDASISDGGTATYGKWKAAADFGLSNGWTGPTFRFRKELNNEITLEGVLVPGATTATTTIGTFPTGFRPKNAITLALPSNAYCTITVSTAGVVKTLNAALGNYNMDGVRFHAKGLDNFDPGY